jgi:hypothetical protein
MTLLVEDQNREESSSMKPCDAIELNLTDPEKSESGIILPRYSTVQ